MLVTGIKSKPVYAPLQADTRGRYHLMLGMGVGAAPLLRVIDEMRSAVGALAAEHAGTVSCRMPTLRRRPSAAAARPVQTFRGHARAARRNSEPSSGKSLMGTRLYVAGPESFIGLVMKIALEFNLNKDEIRAEECGTLARRVYCIHCRGTTENVRTNIVHCIGCDRWLLVRDHYSRRLAAYMGVMVDAEAPGELPPVKEVFL